MNFSLSVHVLLKMNLTNPKNEFFLDCGTSSLESQFSQALPRMTF